MKMNVRKRSLTTRIVDAVCYAIVFAMAGAGVALFVGVVDTAVFWILTR